ncbi:branched-chain amino acid ABC transporter permease [Candidatus Poriferisodalis sp.]|uniref:branched-chain amino acid ABC transporter permease n=1 Tax=Candidatus Poriferisodalis sp. TaxID=3101277 RepID=UPI003B016F3E
MDAVLLLQRVFDTLLNGAIYSSLAIALAIVVRSTGLLNFAQGEMATFSAYVAFVLLSGPTPGLSGGSLVAWVGAPLTVPVAISIAVVLGAVAGGVTERVLIRPLRHAPELAVVSMTVGLFLGLNSLVEQWWGTAPRPFPPVFPSELDDFLAIAGARLRISVVGTWITLLALLALLVAVLKWTRIGLAFRAVSSDRVSADLNGIRSGSVLMYGWVLAAGLGATAAALSANVVVLEPQMMQRVLVYAFAATTLGGLDSPKGALIGGVLVALAETLIPAYVPFIGFELSVVPALLAMVAVLMVRPTGLFGTERVERA